MIAAYRVTGQLDGWEAMARLIDALGKPIPIALVEVAKLGHLLIPAFLGYVSSSSGPPETINGRLGQAVQQRLGRSGT